MTEINVGAFATGFIDENKITNVTEKNISNMQLVSDDLYGLTKDNLFVYCIIVIFIFYLVSTVNITLGIIYASVVAFFFVRYLNTKRKENDIYLAKNLEYKYNLIRPESKFIKNYPVIVQFLYNIQWLYEYSPKNYTDLVAYLDQFLELFEDIGIGVDYCQENYQIAEQYKYRALNALQTHIYSLPINNTMDDTLYQATKSLDKILTGYLGKMRALCNENETRSYHKIANEKPLPFNYFDREKKDDGMYEFC
jgi:hypothetical protein